MKKIKTFWIEVAIALILLLISVAMLISVAGCATDLIGSDRQTVEYYAARNPVRFGDRSYWCVDGAHGYSKVMMAKFDDGYLSEAIQSRITFSGGCEMAINDWANMFIMADELGIEEIWE